MQSDKVTILTKIATLEFAKLSNPAMARFDLTGAQYKILKYLYAHQGETVRQVDIERYYSLTHPTAIGLLDQLEGKGFVNRDVNPTDRRSRVITLTDKARAMREELEKLGETLEREFTAALTEEERLRLAALLQKLLTKFE